MTGRFPLWQQSADTLARTFIEAGYRAVVVCVDAHQLDHHVGRPFDHAFLEALPDTVAPCGEHGEFHRFVYDGPLFSAPVEFDRGEAVHRTYEASPQDDDSLSSAGGDETGAGYWFCDLLPAS